MNIRTTRVFLADDHVLVRQGMRSLLEMEADLVIVGEASNGAEQAQDSHAATISAQRGQTPLCNRDAN